MLDRWIGQDVQMFSLREVKLKVVFPYPLGYMANKYLEVGCICICRGDSGTGGREVV